MRIRRNPGKPSRILVWLATIRERRLRIEKEASLKEKSGEANLQRTTDGVLGTA